MCIIRPSTAYGHRRHSGVCIALVPLLGCFAAGSAVSAARHACMTRPQLVSPSCSRQRCAAVLQTKTEERYYQYREEELLNLHDDDGRG